MSDNLLRIAEEMESAATMRWNEGPLDAAIGNEVAEWAARLHAFWSPERAEFMAAALAYATQASPHLSMPFVEIPYDSYISAYRALVASERTKCGGAWCCDGNWVSPHHCMTCGHVKGS